MRKIKKERFVAVLIAFILGWTGLHNIYLNDWRRFLKWITAALLFIPAMILDAKNQEVMPFIVVATAVVLVIFGLVDMFRLLCMTNEEFNKLYN